MQNKFLSAKQLADQAIAAGSLDAFFQNLLFHTVQNSPATDIAGIETSFFKIASIVLKERYFLFIDEYLQLPEISLPEITQEIVNDMDSIDLFFEQYYNLLKARYVSANEENAAFFREYHRRDLKQDSMLRAFIIIRNRMLEQPSNQLKIDFAIAHFRDGLTGNEACKACFKSYLTVMGMREYAAPVMRESALVLQHAATLEEGVELPQEFIEDLRVESLAATGKDSLKMIKINKDALRALPAEYLSQSTWLLGEKD